MMDDINTIGFPFFHPSGRKKGTFLKFKKIVRDDPLWAIDLQELLTQTTQIASMSSTLFLTPTLQQSRTFDYSHVQEETNARLRNSMTTSAYSSEYGRVPNLTTAQMRELMDLLED